MNYDRCDLPIAVFDSGVGGISVLRELVKVMPNENFIYFGDSANAPYGSKSKAQVLSITRKNLEFLMSRGIKAFVIACNTATSAAAATLREEYKELPIIGIEPAIKPATNVCDNPRVIVMATPLTLKEEKFRALVDRFIDREEIIPVPCKGLVELIEVGKLDGEEIDGYLEVLFAPYKDQKIDAIVLGCTHYPHIKAAIARHMPSAKILDGGLGTALHTQRLLAEKGLLRGSVTSGTVEILNSLGSDEMIKLCERLLNI